MKKDKTIESTEVLTPQVSQSKTTDSKPKSKRKKQAKKQVVTVVTTVEEPTVVNEPIVLVEVKLNIAQKIEASIKSTYSKFIAWLKK